MKFIKKLLLFCFIYILFIVLTPSWLIAQVNETVTPIGLDAQKTFLLIYALISDLMPFLPIKSNGPVHFIWNILVGTKDFIVNLNQGKEISDRQMQAILELVRAEMREEMRHSTPDTTKEN